MVRRKHPMVAGRFPSRRVAGEVFVAHASFGGNGAAGGSSGEHGDPRGRARGACRHGQGHVPARPGRVHVPAQRRPNDLRFPNDWLIRTCLLDSRGHPSCPGIEQIRIETQGPVRSTLCLEGAFPVHRGPRFRARLSFFAGTGLVRLRLAIHNPHRTGIAAASGTWGIRARSSSISCRSI